ncbi:MAG: bifunctional phosphoribosyl-AMP cyclohydrolase/phosphoribosyl-ATP diphosphatase HisIE [Bacteroidetes bacterium]|nr:bifunctional phosphoribosyl-AMP cyclohydrolase/phosphoribosyl-ATP diphosphatase HisIE [Bacteroidota bacterium]
MTLDFSKYADSLMPAIIQDSVTGKVLMLGFMNNEAFAKTKAINKVTFYSRSKKRLWTKGEESGNFLNVIEILADCDKDTLLIKAKPEGAVCHTGADTCFNEKNESEFLFQLQDIIEQRKKTPSPHSYTSQLFSKGINKIAQKVGEEAVELVIEAKDNNNELFLCEAADLIYHYMILLTEKGYSLADVSNKLKSRNS